MSTMGDIDREGRRTNRRRVLLGGGMFIALVASIWMLPLDTWLVASSSWVAAHTVSGALLFIAAFILLTVAMVPGSVLMACSGYLFGLQAGLPLSSVGAALGAATAALLARTLARDWLFARFENDARFVALDKAVVSKGFLIVTLTRLSLLMPYNLLNIIYGLSRIPLGRMTLATWLGMTPAAVLYTYLGSVAANVEELWSSGLDDGWTGRAILASGLVLVVIVTVVIHRTATRALRLQLRETRNH